MNKESYSVFSKIQTSPIDCTGEILVHICTGQGAGQLNDLFIAKPSEIEGEGVIVNPAIQITATPLAVGVRTITTTGGKVLEGKYLGACGVAKVKVVGSVSKGDALYCAASTLDGKYVVKNSIEQGTNNWQIGQALESTSDGGLVKVSTCVPRKV